MEFTSQTGKIPRGYGYVLKPSSLANALRAAGFEIDVHLRRNHGTPLFNADFWPPNPNVPYERLYITAGTMPAHSLPEIRERVEREAIPYLVSWISDILTCDSKSPIRRQSQAIDLLRDVRN